MDKYKLKEWRKWSGETQKEVADLLGISQNNYSYMENGKIKIADNYIDLLCGFYGCSKEDLANAPTHKELVDETKWFDKAYMYYQLCKLYGANVYDEELEDASTGGSKVVKFKKFSRDEGF